MNVISLKLNDGLPVEVTVTMTISEAAAITKLTGATSNTENPEAADVYYEFIGSVFNRYWEDGVDGFMNGDVE